MPRADASTTLSIDIGTTTVVAARLNGNAPADAAAEIVVRMPAVVGVDGDRVVTGRTAAELATTHPDQTVAQLIRRLGDSSPVVLDGRAFSVGELLGHVVTDVVAQADVDPATTRLVFTHPASWKDHRLDLLASIGAAAGFATVEVVSDPIAVIQPLSCDAAAEHLLVVDVGGGTVDATIVETNADGATIVATQSLERLGGNDFDQAVFAHVMASVDGMIEDLDRRDPEVRRTLMTLRAGCTTAKEQLSTDTDATVVVKVPGLDTSVRMTRAEFESVIRPQVEAIATLVDRLVAGAGPNGIDRVITTGGSAAVPLIGETLSGHLGRSVVAGDDPATSTARGAASPPVPDTTIDDPDSPVITSHERPQLMNDEAPTSPGPDAGAGSPATPGTRHTPAPPPPVDKGTGTSTAAKVGVGAAAAAAAAAAAVVFGDDIASALGDDDGADDTMDEFDVVAPADAPAAAEGVAGPDGVPLDTPATARDADDSFDSPAAARTTQRPSRAPADHDGGDSGAGDDARRAPNRPPREAPDAATQATSPPQANPSAAAAAAPAPGAAAETPTTAPDSGDARFEAARATLLERLENFEAPPGTSPEDAAELRQELADAVARFQPLPGQSADEALVAMRDDFDQRVQDFVQDQKIEALVAEAERDNQDAAADAAAAPTDPAATTAPAAPTDDTPTDPTAQADPSAPTDDAASTDAPAITDDPTATDDTTITGDPTVTDDATATDDTTVTDDTTATDDTTVTDPVADVAGDTPVAGADDDTAIGEPPTASEPADGLFDDFDDAAGRFEVRPDLIDRGGLAVDDLAGDTGPVAGEPGAVAPAAGGGAAPSHDTIDAPADVVLDLGDDFVGDSVYSGIVEVDVPLVDLDPAGIAIGLDQPSGDGTVVDGIAVDPAGLEVRAELPPDFVQPVYVEPEPFMADVPIVEEAVSDFGVQGLEDEGNAPVDDVPDDLIDG